jgi:hypothetical protein
VLLCSFRATAIIPFVERCSFRCVVVFIYFLSSLVNPHKNDTGAEYKSKFRSLETTSSEGQQDDMITLLGEVCTFVDMVPPFRDLASRTMGSMIELQKGQLYELGKFMGTRYATRSSVLLL